MSDTSEIRGVAHGRMIELDRDAGLPDGQPVAIVLRPLGNTSQFGEGLTRSFGGWAEDAEELDAFLEWNRQRRKESRPEIEP